MRVIHVVPATTEEVAELFHLPYLIRSYHILELIQ
jgi:hypothetical protein